MASRCSGAFKKNREKTYIRNIAAHGTITCEYCGRKNLKRGLQKTGGATIDHFHPVSGGGSVGSMSNMIVACYDCNQDKADMTYEEYINKKSGSNDHNNRIGAISTVA